MARAAVSSRKLSPSQPEWEVAASSYLTAKASAEEAKKVMDSAKVELMSALEDLGDEDDKGHRVLHLTQSVGKWSGLMRQRRVSNQMDEQAVEAILKDKGLLDRCTVMVPTLDEASIMACLYEGLLDEGDIDQMFPEKVTYALVAVK